MPSAELREAILTLRVCALSRLARKAGLEPEEATVRRLAQQMPDREVRNDITRLYSRRWWHFRWFGRQ